MVKGNFFLTVGGESVFFKWEVLSDDTNLKAFDFIIRDGQMTANKTPASGLIPFFQPLKNVILDRIYEQSNRRPNIVGINVS